LETSLHLRRRNHENIHKHTYTLEEIEDQKFHEQHKKEGLEETHNPWETLDEEQTKEPKIKEFIPFLSSDPFQGTDHRIIEYMHGMTKGDMHNSVDEQVDQGQDDYIELRFQTTIILKHHSILYNFLTYSQSKNLVPRILVSLKAYLPNLNMSIVVFLLRIWIHWKYFYTREKELFFQVE
jgi:hypothetical protein